MTFCFAFLPLKYMYLFDDETRRRCCFNELISPNFRNARFCEYLCACHVVNFSGHCHIPSARKPAFPWTLVYIPSAAFSGILLCTYTRISPLKTCYVGENRMMFFCGTVGSAPASVSIHVCVAVTYGEILTCFRVWHTNYYVRIMS